MTVRNIVSAAASYLEASTRDAQFQNTTLLLSGDGTNGAQNNTFLTTIPGGQYTASFPGSGSAVYTSSPIVITTTPFTIEAWVNPTAYQSSATLLIWNAAWSFGNNRGWHIYFDASGKVGLAASQGSWNSMPAVLTSSVAIPLNSWTHIACVRDSSNVIRFYINGVADANTVTYASSLDLYNGSYGTYRFNVGTQYADSAFQTGVSFAGRVNNLRISNSTAFYTSNFTPSSLPLSAINGTSLLTFQNSTFVDNSTNAYTFSTNGTPTMITSSTFLPISATGTPTQGSVTPYWPDGQWSNYFSNAPYLSAPYTTPTQFGSGDFTVEAWMYLTDISKSNYLFCQQNASVNTNADLSVLGAGIANGGFYFGWNVGSTRYNATAPTGSMKANTWHHVACVRNGSSFTVYIDGVAKATTTSSVTVNTLASTPRNGIGGYTSPFGNEFCSGYISNLRMVKGTALYTSNFTPSTTPLTAVSGTSLLTCQSNRFKDNSSNNFAITVTGTPSVQAFEPFEPSASYATSVGGSGYFNGGTSGLSIPSNSAFTLGTANFTIEAWIYCPVAPTGTANTIIRQRANGSLAWDLQVQSGTMYFCYGAGYTAYSEAVKAGVWEHYAAVKYGGSMYLYKNGVLSATIANNFNFSATDGVLVGIGGDSSDTAYPFTGYIANARVVKGTAVYTAPFTPPTSPVAAIANTSLLLNFDNAGIYDSTAMSNLITVDNTQISTTVKKYGTGSLSFDGTNDYLQLVENGLFDFGTGDFTVEAWINMNAFTTDKGSVMADLGPTNGGWMLAVRGASQVSWGQNQISWDLSTSGFTMSTGTWYHIAVCRSGTSLKIFIDGTAYATATNTTAYNIINSFVGVGARQLTTGTYGPGEYFNGYIDDLRVTRGYARYTTNFTPPTSALPKR